MPRRLEIRRASTCIASLAVLLWPAAGYPLALAGAARVRGRMASGVRARVGAELPPITVVVPTYKESALVERRLENLLRCEYPDDRLSIVVVDSASGDGTADLARSFAARHPSVDIRVVEERARAGKAAAINIGLAHCDTPLVMLTDAPTEFRPDALRIVAECFDDPAVGAATGYFELDDDTGRANENEVAFWRLRNQLRTLEAELDSTPFLTGEMCCFRRELVTSIDPDTLADDMNLALTVRRRGYRTIVDNRAIFTEPRTTDHAELLRTKSRRAAGGMQELLKARDMLFRPRFGAFGSLILPSAWLYYLPTRVPALLALASVARGSSRRPKLVAPAAVLLALCAASPRARRTIRTQAQLVVFNEAVLIAGWLRIAGGHMDVRWTQERSTRTTPRVEADQQDETR